MASKGSHVIIITKKARAPAQHGGAWKVAYADFVTAMMALFIVLWLLSQTDQQTRQRLSEYFRTGMFSGAPALVMGGSGVATSAYLDAKGGILQIEQKSLLRGADAVRDAVAQAINRNPDLAGMKKDIDIKVTEEGLLIQILDGGQDLLFDLSSAELKPRLKALLEAIAPVLGRLNNKIQVHGHTDARPFPAAAGRTNWDLSFERANNARRTLESHGLKPGQLVGVFAHGSTSPYVPDNPLDPRNRRLAILAVRRSSDKAPAHGAAGSSRIIKQTTTAVAPLALRDTSAL
jgi:chemotaxis protein MotB